MCLAQSRAVISHNSLATILQIRPIKALFTNILSPARTLPIGTEVNRE
jgi:hypothetical protein